MFIPSIGKLLIKIGRTAQCIAQATEVVIPKASQFILNFILRTGKDSKTQQGCKYYFYIIGNDMGQNLEPGRKYPVLN